MKLASNRRLPVLPLLLALVVVAAYATSFRAVFVFDDDKTITDNPRIRRLWPPPDDWRQRRFVVDATFALNYAVGGDNPTDYHLVNLALHLAAALVLYTLASRTLGRPGAPDWMLSRRAELAFFVSALWAAHPLTTSAVTYTCQRYEVMMALFYLLTIYGVARAAAAEGRGRRGWQALAVAACALGMASKEIMVTAPLVALVYDRIFLSGSFRGLFRQRWAMYAGLALTWVLLGVLLATGVPDTLSSADQESPFTRMVRYALTQAGVITHYLRLSFWPHPLCLDYGWPRAETAGQIIPGALAVGGLLAATAVGLIVAPRRAFPGFFFFAVLAPTSSFLPRPDYAFEHRMYLPLTAVVAAAVLAAARACRGLPVRRGPDGNAASLVFRLAAALALAALAATTGRRNTVFHSRQAAWSETLRRCPGNYRVGLAVVDGLLQEGRFAEAETAASRLLGDIEAVLARPGLKHAVAARNPWHYRPAAHDRIGLALLGQGRAEEALPPFERASSRGDDREAAYRLHAALAFRALDRPEEAAAQLERALAVNPDMDRAHALLGAVLSETGAYGPAREHLEMALRLNPGLLFAHVEMAWLLATCPLEELRDPARALRMVNALPVGVRDGSWRASEVAAACHAANGNRGAAADAAARALRLGGARRGEGGAPAVDSGVGTGEPAGPDEKTLRRIEKALDSYR
ncbi:MAG: tetratricopeptide repeat protein [Lentisphaerae bacterium]|nr:tetratricopeptide repeat protein [Lentisphaerota bacterium]